MFRNPVRLLNALMSWTDGRVYMSSVCTETCQSAPILPRTSVQRGATSVCKCVGAPWALPVSQKIICRVNLWSGCVRFTVYMLAICPVQVQQFWYASTSHYVQDFPDVQGRSCQHTASHHITWHWGFVPLFRAGTVCALVFPLSSLLSLKIQCWGLHPCRDQWIFYCHYLRQSCANCENMSSLEKMKENAKATW